MVCLVTLGAFIMVHSTSTHFEIYIRFQIGEGMNRRVASLDPSVRRKCFFWKDFMECRQGHVYDYDAIHT
jgi:hypothetical protein